MVYANTLRWHQKWYKIYFMLTQGVAMTTRWGFFEWGHQYDVRERQPVRIGWHSYKSSFWNGAAQRQSAGECQRGVVPVHYGWSRSGTQRRCHRLHLGQSASAQSHQLVRGSRLRARRHQVRVPPSRWPRLCLLTHSLSALDFLSLRNECSFQRCSFFPAGLTCHTTSFSFCLLPFSKCEFTLFFSSYKLSNKCYIFATTVSRVIGYEDRFRRDLSCVWWDTVKLCSLTHSLIKCAYCVPFATSLLRDVAPGFCAVLGGFV